MKLYNRLYQNAWRPNRGTRRAAKQNKSAPAQLKLNFCSEPWRPLVVVAAAAARTDRPMTEEELTAEFERLFP